MVQSYQSPVRVFKYPFELVMAAYERRFPTCDLIPIFIGSDILSEYKSADGAEHVIVRRCKLNIDAPYVLKKIVGIDYILFIQKNALDRKHRVLTIEAYNESFSARLSIREKCIYYVHPENKYWTCFEQAAALDVKSFFGFESTVEKLAMKHYSQNIQKGKEIIEHFIKVLKEENVSTIPVWTEPANFVRDKKILTSPSRLTTSPMSVSAVSNLTIQDNTSNPKQKRRDSQFQLDADYIQRYVGRLSPLQESRFVQLRRWVGELQKGKMPSDTTLLRFLQARDFNLEKSRELLSESLMWRKKYQVDKLLGEYEMPAVVKDYFPGGWHYNTNDGQPLYVLRVGHLDVKGLVKSIGQEGLLKLTLSICEEGLIKTTEATDELGRPIIKWTILVDLEGLNMRHLWRPGIMALLRIIEIVESNYPETMGHVLIVRAPRVFPILWAIVSTFINEITRSKIVFLFGSDFTMTGSLADYIPLKNIPDFLNGQCMTSLVSGGIVPKTRYMSIEEYEKQRHRNDGIFLSEDTMYHSVCLTKGQVHEVLLKNEDVGSVITWDFDVVLKQEAIFSVFWTKEKVIESHDDITANTGPLQLKQFMASDPESHKSVVAKTWQEGKEYKVLEEHTICHDGESIQGSHVTSLKGTYILQWKFNDGPVTCSNPMDLIDSLTNPQIKILYFYDVISSAEFKGSVTSLQSNRSGDTTKSISSSVPSR